MKHIIINHIPIELERKKIKNMYLKVLPPDGRIHITAPMRMSEDEIRSFVIAKQEWVLGQQAKIRQRHSGQIKDCLSGEAISLWGQSFTLEVITKAGRGRITLQEDKLLMEVPADSLADQRKKLLNHWYKEQLLQRIPYLILKWEKIIGVKSEGFTICDMKTRWGTCNIRSKKICLSLQLAKKKPDCLEYVIVHELVHLLEPSHNGTFKAYLDRFYPDWRSIKKEMNGNIVS